MNCSKTHLTDTVKRTPVLTISGRWGNLDMTGCFSTTRALQRHHDVSDVHNRLPKSKKKFWRPDFSLFKELDAQGDSSLFNFLQRSREFRGICAVVLPVLLLQFFKLLTQFQECFQDSGEPACATSAFLCYKASSSTCWKVTALHTSSEDYQERC